VRGVVASLGVVVAGAGLAGCGSSPHVAKNTLIVPGRSIGPISFAESKTKIEAAYGKGQPVTLRQGTANPRVVFYPAVSIGVIYAGRQSKARVIILETDAPQYRTKSGVGVGSTVGQLKKIGTDCRPQDGICGIVGSSGSKPATTFFLDDQRKRVTRIAIAPLGG
jgi:hypothetical protein